MKKFLTNLFDSFFCDLKNKNKNYYIMITSIVLGLILGTILIFTIDDIDAILNISNKNYLELMHGTANLSKMFLDNLGWILIADLIVIALSCCIIAFALGIFYILYQSALVALTIGSMIKCFGFVGIINSLIFILPINLINIVLISLLLVTLYNYFSQNRKCGLPMFSQNNDRYIYIKLILILLVQVVLCFILSFIIPYMFRSLIFVNF